MPKLSRSTLLDGRTFVLIVVLGGLFTLQSSNNLDAPKVIYLIGAVAATAGAVWTAPKWLAAIGTDAARPWLIVSCTFGAVLIGSLAVSRLNGTPLTSWLRDAAAYAVFAIAPILALALARSASRKWTITLFAMCGSLAVVSFAVVWLSRRAILELPIDRLILPTGFMAACFLALASAMALSATGRRWLWAMAGGAVLGLFFVSGTRTTLLLVAVPIGAGLLAGRPRRTAAKTVGMIIGMGLAIGLSATIAIGLSNGTLSFGTPGPQGANATPTQIRNLSERVGGVGQLMTDPGSDHSFQERWTETQVAWQAFTSSPILGVGPGNGFHWTDSVHNAHDEFTLDTPLVYFAKFGLLGLVPLVLLFAAYVRLAATLRKYPQARMEYLLMVGCAIVLVVVGALGSPIEDKGASFSLIFVLALGLRALAQVRPPLDQVVPAIGH
jgi:hypothetical protein